MQEITVTEPCFVKKFKCSGTQCRDHCCKMWKISLDKATVKRYLTCQDPEIQGIAKNSICITKEDINHWAFIALNANSGGCPYLTGDNLCQVQKKLGAQALSLTCKTFPRIERVYKNALRKSMNLSCPEVSSIILTEPDSMTLRETYIIKPKANTGPVFYQSHKILNLFCLSLIDYARNDVDVGLYALLKITLFIDKFKHIDNIVLAKIESIYKALLSQLSSGELRAELSKLSGDKKIKTSLVILFQDYFRHLSPTRAGHVLDYYIQCLLRTLLFDKNSSLEHNIDMLDTIWHKEFLENSENGIYFNNLILYKLWGINYPNTENIDSLRTLYMISAEYYFIRLLIASSIFERKHLEKEDVINIVYSFHSLSQHSENIQKEFHRHIETVRMGDDISMIHLLT